MLYAHLTDLFSYLTLLLSCLEHYLWQFVGETNAFLTHLTTALKLHNMILGELRNLYLIYVPLRLMIHTKTYVFYFDPAFVVP